LNKDTFTMQGRLRHAVLATLTSAWLSAVAAPSMPLPVEPGRPLPSLSLLDQHGQPWQPAADARLLLLAASRSASSRVQAVLGSQPRDFLALRRAAYLADMSRMPGFITRSFALPALKEQPFTVGVSLQDGALAGWPQRDDAVTLIHLEGGRVARISFAETEAALRDALGL
jgi:hypothetical protein